MKTVNDAFNEFNEALKLDPTELARAQALHNTITRQIKERGLLTSAFLQGSLARKTMKKPLRDVDKVAILAAALRHLLEQRGGAWVVAGLYTDALAILYPRAHVEVKRHAVTLVFDDDVFSFDIVPAFETDDGTDDVWIMDTEAHGPRPTRSETKPGGWKRSNTRNLIRVVQARNQLCDGHWVEVVRMLKHLVAERLDALVPGLHVESLTYAVVRTFETYEDAVTAVLCQGSSQLRLGYSDPTGQDRISDRVSEHARARLADHFDRLAQQATVAQAHTAAGEHAQAIAIWYAIFGAPFPKLDADSGAVLAKAYSAKLTSVGTLSSALPGRATRPTRGFGGSR